MSPDPLRNRSGCQRNGAGPRPPLYGELRDLTIRWFFRAVGIPGRFGNFCSFMNWRTARLRRLGSDRHLHRRIARRWERCGRSPLGNQENQYRNQHGEDQTQHPANHPELGFQRL